MLRYQKGYIFNGCTFVVNKEDVHNAKDDMFVEATALLPDGWISVKERLPEQPEYDWVLIIGKFMPEGGNTVPHVGELRNGKWWVDCFDEPYEDACSVEVTHWMPLPEPPKEDAHD